MDNECFVERPHELTLVTKPPVWCLALTAREMMIAALAPPTGHQTTRTSEITHPIVEVLAYAVVNDVVAVVTEQRRLESVLIHCLMSHDLPRFIRTNLCVRGTDRIHPRGDFHREACASRPQGSAPWALVDAPSPVYMPPSLSAPR